MHTVLAGAVVAVGLGLPPAAGRESADLAWARGVADNFRDSLLAAHPADAEMLVTAEMKARYEKYPQTTPLARRLLDVWYDGFRTGSFTAGRVAPGRDEAVFTYGLAGERNRQPVAGVLTVRVAREEGTGRWRVCHFSHVVTASATR